MLDYCYSGKLQFVSVKMLEVQEPEVLSVAGPGEKEETDHLGDMSVPAQDID